MTSKFATRASTRLPCARAGCVLFILASSAQLGFAQQTAGPVPVVAPASEAAPTSPDETWNWHAQNTDIVQGYPTFSARYSGPNSLSTQGEVQHTVTADLFGGVRLSSGFEAHADFLVWQGFGLSRTLGIEAFPNGDAYKLGTAEPNYTFARLFVRRTIGLSGTHESVSDDQLTLRSARDASRLTLTAGRFAMTDVFDTNTYAADPHTQFMNWAMLGNLTWDYAADSVGFTTGVTAELNVPNWALKYGFFQLPAVPNSFTSDDRLLMWPHRGADGPLDRSWSMAAELDRPYTIEAHPGVIRLLAWLNEADMATYQAETALLVADGPNADLVAARSYRYRHGFGLNWEQEISSDVGLFSRIGWNDGREEAWAYTDANWTASLGASVKGNRWRRSDDTVGIAYVASGASSANQAFLEAGGAGILAGDGALSYGIESVLETYYNANLWKGLHASVDYQFVDDPAFNRARGPVSIFGVRLHYSL